MMFDWSDCGLCPYKSMLNGSYRCSLDKNYTCEKNEATKENNTQSYDNICKDRGTNKFNILCMSCDGVTKKCCK